MGVTVANIENRIFSWQSIPQPSRIILITSMIVIIFITPNFAEGYYESSWNLIDSDSQNNYNAAIIDENGDAWVFGDDGEIIFGEKMGEWIQFDSPTNEDLKAAYANQELIVAAGNNGSVIYKQYSSENWIEIKMDNLIDAHSVSINSNNEIFIVSDNGEIWCFKQQNWIKIESLVSEDLNDIVFEGERGLISGSSGLILGSENNGETWEIRETPE